MTTDVEIHTVGPLGFGLRQVSHRAITFQTCRYMRELSVVGKSFSIRCTVFWIAACLPVFLEWLYMIAALVWVRTLRNRAVFSLNRYRSLLSNTCLICSCIKSNDDSIQIRVCPSRSSNICRFKASLPYSKHDHRLGIRNEPFAPSYANASPLAIASVKTQPTI